MLGSAVPVHFVIENMPLNFSDFKQQIGAFQLYLVLIVIFSLTLYGGFHWGNSHYRQQQALVAIHVTSIGNLKSENATLTKNLNVLGVELEVAKLAQQQNFLQTSQGIERENALRTQLAFYQQVMAPELNEQGFLIQDFIVQTALSDNSYRFELALMQQNKSKNTLKGNIEVTLIGSENGQAKQYSMAELLSGEAATSLTFAFKYFQVLKGEIQLPESFTPEKVSVRAEIFQFKRKKGQLTSVFDWSISDTQ
jgi:hypothetical protein